ncbi:MAG: hypothetical protein Kow0074_05250 [Candidatus Zixiibacteriota bacterium]
MTINGLEPVTGVPNSADNSLCFDEGLARRASSQATQEIQANETCAMQIGDNVDRNLGRHAGIEHWSIGNGSDDGLIRHGQSL